MALRLQHATLLNAQTLPHLSRLKMKYHKGLDWGTCFASVKIDCFTKFAVQLHLELVHIFFARLYPLASLVQPRIDDRLVLLDPFLRLCKGKVNERLADPVPAMRILGLQKPIATLRTRTSRALRRLRVRARAISHPALLFVAEGLVNDTAR